MTAAGSAVMVGMADIQVVRGNGQLMCLGLGSCIGLCGLDPVSGVAGMVHVMLPEAFQGKGEEKPGKFADTGVPALLEAMRRAGADLNRTKFAMAGGAQVFKFSANTETKLDIGTRNAQAVEANLRKLGLRVTAQDTGGNTGRTVIFTVETGIYIVRTVTSGEKTLCTLRG
jgi:chemotaxis protein CheD